MSTDFTSQHFYRLYFSIFLQIIPISRWSIRFLCSPVKPLFSIFKRACRLLGSIEPGTNGSSPTRVPNTITPLKQSHNRRGVT